MLLLLEEYLHIYVVVVLAWAWGQVLLVYLVLGKEQAWRV